MLTTIAAPRMDHMGGGEWALTNLSVCNVILGRNGCGKSQLLRSLRDRNVQGSHYIVPERVGAFDYNANMLTEVSNSTGLRNRTQYNSTDNYRSLTVARIPQYFNRRGWSSNPVQLDSPSLYFSALSDLISDFRIEPSMEPPHYVMTRTSSGRNIQSINELSSGEAQLLSIGLDVATTVGIWKIHPSPNNMLCIDEPDAHIHRDMQVRLARFLKVCSGILPSFQIFVATHSMSLCAALASEFGDDARIAYMNREDVSLAFTKHSQIQRDISSILGGHILMGYLFSHPIILVEGDDDYQVWCHIARSGRKPICILPCNGDDISNYRNSIERVVGSVSDVVRVVGHMVLDGDKAEHETRPEDTRYIRTSKLACHECENLYLTKEVLQEIGIESWDQSCQKIIDRSSEFGAKEAQLKSIRSIDKKMGDFKGVINQVTQILDAKNVPWTVRVGKYLGRNTPSGEMLEFLGPNVSAIVS